MSGHVGSVMSELGVVENVGVAVEISFAVVIQAGISCIYVDFKSSFQAAMHIGFLKSDKIV